MAASKQVVNEISNRLKLIQPTCRDSWPWDGEPGRTLVLFLPWLNSKEKHVRKYTDVYSNLGLDVLCMKSSFWDVLWPPRSMKAARNLVKLLQNRYKDYDSLFIHAMSVGGYNLTSLLMVLNEDSSLKHLSDKVRGVIYDSVVIGAGRAGLSSYAEAETEAEDGSKPKPTDAMELMIKGMAQAISKRKCVFSSLKAVAKIYFGLTKSKTVDFYVKSFNTVAHEPFKVPTLCLGSKDDPMSDYRVLLHIVDTWRDEHSLPVRVQLWDESGHAQHLVFHKTEYLDAQREFMSGLFGGNKCKL